MTGLRWLYVRAVDDESRYLNIESSLKHRRKTLVLRIGSLGDTGSSAEIEVTEWDLLNLLKQLDVGTDELYFDRVFDNDKKRELLLAAPVEALSLSIRTSHCLREAKIATIGQLTETSAQELKRIKAFGNKSLREISEILEMLGFRLKAEENDS